MKIESRNHEIEMKNIKDDHFSQLLSDNVKKIELITIERNEAVVSVYFSFDYNYDDIIIYSSMTVRNYDCLIK